MQEDANNDFIISDEQISVIKSILNRENDVILRLKKKQNTVEIIEQKLKIQSRIKI